MALAVIWLSVGVGVVLGLWQRVAARTTGPIRTFAVVAAGLVVALSLLPHVIASEGLAGLAVALGSVALVPALERLVPLAKSWAGRYGQAAPEQAPLPRGSTEGLRLELGFAGLLIHRFGDGVVMAVEGHGNELSWAIGAHEVPIVALVTLAYARRGLRTALLRAALLGLASSFGLWLVRAIPGGWHELHGWVDAVAAGILVHILAYEALPERLETARERASDGLGAALGLLLVLWPSLREHSNEPNVALRLLQRGLEVAPFLAFGLLCSAALLTFGARASAQARLRVGVARPWPGAEAFTLGVGLLGWLTAAAYLLGAALVALLATLGLRRVSPPAGVGDTTLAPSEPARFWPSVEGLILRVGGWLALGLLAASYIDSFVGGDAPLGAPSAPALGLLLLAVGVPASVCTAGAVPIAAALVAKGLSPVIAAAGLGLGAVLGETCGALSRAGFGARRTLLLLAPLGVLGLVSVAWLGAAFTPAPLQSEPSRMVGALEWAALAGLSVLGARGVWRVGIRGWLGVSLRALGPARRSAHAH